MLQDWAGWGADHWGRGWRLWGRLPSQRLTSSVTRTPPTAGRTASSGGAPCRRRPSKARCFPAQGCEHHPARPHPPARPHAPARGTEGGELGHVTPGRNTGPQHRAATPGRNTGSQHRAAIPGRTRDADSWTPAACAKHTRAHAHEAHAAHGTHRHCTCLPVCLSAQSTREHMRMRRGTLDKARRARAQTARRARAQTTTQTVAATRMAGRAGRRSRFIRVAVSSPDAHGYTTLGRHRAVTCGVAVSFFDT
jgi:hypothetical protein